MIHPSLHKMYSINPDQEAIISHREGPLLVIAGPGSGKTRSLTLLAMNLLLTNAATPDQLILCTYTEKAAREMLDRLFQIAHTVQFEGDLSTLKINTIHGLCTNLIREHLHDTHLGSDFEILNQFTQSLLIFEHLPHICPGPISTLFHDLWGNPWLIAKNLAKFFNKIAEELIYDGLKEYVQQLSQLNTARQRFLHALTYAYHHYQKILSDTNHVDFAHIQKCAYNLLQQKPELMQNVRYVLVDEYQDTNYIQEQLLLMFAHTDQSYNLVVVGDEDQSLYRFRGATVRNILEFSQKPEFKGTCKQLHLTTNYRSHQDIIGFYNQWMDIDWRNAQAGTSSRISKTIQANPDQSFSGYPTILSLQEPDIHQEAERLAEIIHDLKAQGRIADYNQVAFLLYSVRPYMSAPYLKALQKRNIPVHCPRARQYFEQPEICLMLACFASLLNYDGSRDELALDESDLPIYIKKCQKMLQTFPTLIEEVDFLKQERDTKPLLAYFYHLLFHEDFAPFLANDDQRANLVAFSRYLATFEGYFHRSQHHSTFPISITAYFFQRFLCLLYDDGANLPEDLMQALPTGHVQMMTIHQAKGLEFPIVIVGRLDQPPSLANDEHKNEHKYLQNFYHRPPSENAQQIAGFDLRRLYYVAFSRARHLLLLSAKKQLHKTFTPQLLSETREYAYAYTYLHTMPTSPYNPHSATLKPHYSFTGHIQLYATCPRRFQFFRQFNFTPRRSTQPFTGQAVHNTLEHIHRLALANPSSRLDDALITRIFRRTLTFMAATNLTSWDEHQSEQALQQVLNYVHTNQHLLKNIVGAEDHFRLMRERYILTGKIDLLIQGKHGLDIIDFKTSKRPDHDTPSLAFYKQQLYLYASALKARNKQSPQRIFIYWTAEQQRQDALMEIPYTPNHLQETNHYIENIITNIQQEHFSVPHPPNPHICQSCDVRHLCRRENII